MNTSRYSGPAQASTSKSKDSGRRTETYLSWIGVIAVVASPLKHAAPGFSRHGPRAGLAAGFGAVAEVSWAGGCIVRCPSLVAAKTNSKRSCAASRLKGTYPSIPGEQQFVHQGAVTNRTRKL